MQWFRIDLAMVFDPLYLAHPAGVRAGHLVLLALAAREENGGVIEGCGAWPTRSWSIAGINKAVVDQVVKAGLARWLSEPPSSLLVAYYDVEGERQLHGRSEKASNAAKTMHQKRAQARAMQSASGAGALLGDGARTHHGSGRIVSNGSHPGRDLLAHGSSAAHAPPARRLTPSDEPMPVDANGNVTPEAIRQEASRLALALCGGKATGAATGATQGSTEAADEDKAHEEVIR
jgi:hypothetical protein